MAGKSVHLVPSRAEVKAWERVIADSMGKDSQHWGPGMENASHKTGLISLLIGRTPSSLISSSVFSRRDTLASNNGQENHPRLLSLPGHRRFPLRLRLVSTINLRQQLPVPFHNLSNTLTGSIVSSFHGGAVLGTILNMLFAHSLGRKKTIFLGACISVVGSALQAGAVAMSMLIVAR